MTDELFLLDPKNRDVATGNAPYEWRSMAVAVNTRWLQLLLMLLLPLGIFSLFPALLALTPNWNEYFRLSSAGVTTLATVVDRYTSESDDSTDYYIVYEFRYSKPDGEPVVQRDEDRVSFDEYKRLGQGMKIQVIYDPNDPTISSVKPPDIIELVKTTGVLVFRLGFLPCSVILLIPLAVLFPFYILSLLGVWRERRFARHGKLIYGTLTSISGDTDYEYGFIIDMHYQFTTPDGRTLQKREQLTRNDLKDKPLPPVGTRIAIWYMDTKTYKAL